MLNMHSHRYHKAGMVGHWVSSMMWVPKQWGHGGVVVTWGNDGDSGHHIHWRLYYGSG